MGVVCELPQLTMNKMKDDSSLSSIPPFAKLLLSSYCVPGTVLEG